MGAITPRRHRNRGVGDTGRLAGFRAKWQDRRRRHGLDAGRHWPRADDDDSGPRVVLCRNGAQEERARHHGAVHGRDIFGFHPVGRHRLLAHLHRRRRLYRHARSNFPAWLDAQLDLPARQDHPRKPVHDLSNDLRHHHGGAGGGLGRGSNALLRISPVLRILAAAGLCADRALGLGRRLPRQPWRNRFRRRVGGASQCRQICHPTISRWR